MENAFDEMNKALTVAKHVFKAADNNSSAMARILVGRLRNVRSYTLAELKKELKNFNAHTGTWKN